MENQFFKAKPIVILSIEWKLDDIQKINVELQKEMILNLLQNDNDEQTKNLLEGIDLNGLEFNSKDNRIVSMNVSNTNISVLSEIEVNKEAEPISEEKPFQSEPPIETENIQPDVQKNEGEKVAEVSMMVEGLDLDDLSDGENNENSEKKTKKNGLIEIVLNNFESIFKKNQDVYKIHDFDEYKDSNKVKTYPYILKKILGGKYVVNFSNGRTKAFDQEIGAKLFIAMDGKDEKKIKEAMNDENIIEMTNERKTNDELNKILNYMYIGD